MRHSSRREQQVSAALSRTSGYWSCRSTAGRQPNNTTNVAPFSGDTILPGPISLDNPWQNFPGGNPFPYSPNPATAKFTAAGAYMPLRPDLKTTKVYNWNLGVQRQFTTNLFASAS